MPRRQYPYEYVQACLRGTTIDQAMAEHGTTREWKSCDGRTCLNVEKAQAIGDVIPSTNAQTFYRLVELKDNGLKLFEHSASGSQTLVRPYPRFQVDIWSTDYAPDSGFFEVKFAATEELAGITCDHLMMIPELSTVGQAWELIRNASINGVGGSTSTNQDKFICVVKQFRHVKTSYLALPVLLCKGKWSETKVVMKQAAMKVTKALTKKPSTRKVSSTKPAKVTMKKVTKRVPSTKALENRAASLKKPEMRASSSIILNRRSP